MKRCPVCATHYPDDVRFCPTDGQTLRADQPATDLIGQIVADRYHVLRKLGEGGMGQVYLAEHVKMGRQSAIKVMNPAMAHDGDAVSRFNREAANASRITHPNVCAIYDFGETPDGLIYLAMEFIGGESLTELLEREGPLPPQRAARIFVQVAAALQAAHDLDIVHRDLKPDNIMLMRGRDGEDVVKVVDFGIAKAMSGAESQKVTRTGLVVGTPEFMSPEQLAGDPVDGRSDTYALGLVLFRMLTGRLPFEGSSIQETMIKRLTDAPATLAAVRPDLVFPRGLQEALHTALARSPATRYQTVKKFASDVASLVGLNGVSQAGTAALPATRDAAEQKTHLLDPGRQAAPKRRAPAIWAGVALAVIALAGGGYALLGNRTDPAVGAVVPQPASAPSANTSGQQLVSAPKLPVVPVAARLSEWVDSMDSMKPTALRDSARRVFNTPGVEPKDRALAAYLVATAYAKLENRDQSCVWARRAASLANERSYGRLTQDVCRS